MAQQRICLNCRHFHNTPAYLESVYKGLSSLSSGYASVRKDDGICEALDRYLSADNFCDRFEASNCRTPLKTS